MQGQRGQVLSPVAHRAVLGARRPLPQARPALLPRVAGEAVVGVQGRVSGQIVRCDVTGVARACGAKRCQAETQRQRACVPACTVHAPQAPVNNSKGMGIAWVLEMCMFSREGCGMGREPHWCQTGA